MNLPEGAPYQLINGELIMSAAPKKNHQDICREIMLAIGNYLRQNKKGLLYNAPFDVHFDSENVFQPDIVFISNENLKNFRDGYFYGAPDLVVEILSRANAYEDLTRKFRAYEKYAVKEYFIVDPESKDVTAYRLTKGKYSATYKEAGVIISEILGEEFSF